MSVDDWSGYADVPPAPRGSGRAWTAALLGIAGLAVSVFAPWGALICAAAIVLAVAAGRDWLGTLGARITALATGLTGIAIALVWLMLVKALGFQS